MTDAQQDWEGRHQHADVVASSRFKKEIQRLQKELQSLTARQTISGKNLFCKICNIRIVAADGHYRVFNDAFCPACYDQFLNILKADTRIMEETDQPRYSMVVTDLMNQITFNRKTR